MKTLVKMLRLASPGLALAAALGGLAAPWAASAKPLYITVPRAYGTHEQPVVDLAFSGAEPVELRVLRPDDLAAFIGRQLDVRRAYEPPSTTANPGRALSRGLNGVRGPGDTLLMALDAELRRALAPELPARVPEGSGAATRLREGPERLVGIPPGMSLVRTEYLNLDLGGASTMFNVPGFEDSGWGATRTGDYQERRLALASLPAGVHVLQLVQGVVEGQVVLVVTDLSAQVKQTDGEVLVRVAGRSQLPVEGAAVTVHLPGGIRKTATTDEKGEARVEVTEPRVVVTASSGEGTALVDTDFYSTLSVTPDVFIYTDRPIYRPGDVVRFRGVVRQPDGFLARLLRPRNPTVEVTLAPDEGSAVTTRATVGEMGTFSGQAAVPEDLGTVVVRVSARLDSRAHQAEARVQEYVKPTFYLELLTDEETVTPGAELEVKVRARRYAGGAPKNAAYEVFLYRSLLDAPSWVDDSGRGGKGSQVTYGSSSTTEGGLSVPQRLYSSVQARGAGGQGEDPWESAPKLDAEGEVVVKVPVPELAEEDRAKPWRYSLSIRARDEEGTFATGAQSFFLSQTDLLAAVRAARKLVRPGEMASFTVRATTLSGKPYGETGGRVQVRLLSADGDMEKVLEKELATGEDGTFRLEVKAPGPGVLEAQVTLRARKGEGWTGSDSTLVVGEGGAPVVRVPAMTLQSGDEVLEPGRTGEVVALLPEHWGSREKNEGAVWVTLGGSRLFSTQLVRVRGTSLVHRFDVERRFGSALYVSVAYPTPSGRWEERTVPFRIVPRERVLLVNVSPRRQEAAPLTEQTVDLRVTDASGNGIASEVSVGVVDKAIYALQAEFRPRILDFFYPLGRNNVSTFTSSEFQGLGYGERLARMLGGLPHQAFAAVKPPQKPQREQDTAYWSPGVLTDRDGRATVTFKLPSNQTLWTVTAVAVDASGRFGESTAQFATRGALNLAANLPQFMREGDVAQASVRASLGAKARGGGTLKVKAGLGGALAAGEVSQALALKARDEQSIPLSLEARGPGEAVVTLDGSGVGDPVRDERRFDVVPAGVDETVVVSRRGWGELKLDVPPGATVLASRLTVMPSLLGAAMENLRELLSYPYGCTEQLVSTTVPNLAVYATLENAGALARLEPDAQALLAEARSRAVQGTQRILQAAVKGSGFAWYPGHGEPSVPMTLVALDGLSWAIESGLLARNDARVADAATWLEGQEGLPMPLAAQRAYVLARLQGQKQAANVRNLLAGNAGSDPYGLAMAVLASEHAGIDQEPALRPRLQEIAAQSRGVFLAAATWDGDEWAWRFPLRRAGYSAVLGHAGSKADGLDEASARRRATELLSEPGLSTFDRSTVLLHSQWLIRRELKDFKRAPPPKLEAGGARFEPSAGTFTAVLGKEVRQATVSETDAAISWRARVRTPPGQVQPKASGMALRRRYLALRGEEKVELRAGDAVALGEEVYVELEMNAHPGEQRRWHRSAYHVLEDAVPAGFTVLQEDKQYRGAPYELPLSHESLRRRVPSPQRVTWFFEEPAFWSDSPRVIGYVMRARFAGTFSAPPARVEDMYAADIFARTASASLKVDPPGASR